MSNRFDSVNSTDAQYSPTDRAGSCIQHAYSEVFDCQLKQQRSRSGDQSESLTNLEFSNIFASTTDCGEASQGRHSHQHDESPAGNQPTDSTSANNSAAATGDSTSSDCSAATTGNSAASDCSATAAGDSSCSDSSAAAGNSAASDCSTTAASDSSCSDSSAAATGNSAASDCSATAASDSSCSDSSASTGNSAASDCSATAAGDSSCSDSSASTGNSAASDCSATTGNSAASDSSASTGNSAASDCSATAAGDSSCSDSSASTGNSAASDCSTTAAGDSSCSDSSAAAGNSAASDCSAASTGDSTSSDSSAASTGDSNSSDSSAASTGDSTSSDSSAASTGDSTSSDSSAASTGDSAVTPSNSTIDTPPAGSDRTPTLDSNATIVGLHKMPVGICAANYSDLDGNGSKITPDLLNSLKSQGYGGLDQVYDLPRDRALTQSELNNLNQDLETAKAAGMPLVLRFRYADDAGQPDAPANVILSQMKQLSPVLSANEGAIGIMEMGFVGAWGEWNRSTNNPLNDKDFALQKQMYDIYSQSLPDTPIAFSHADTLREMFGENSIPKNVMLFDDSIGKQNGSDSTQNDAGQFYQPGDYEWAMQHRVMFTGENQEVGTPQLVLQRIHDLNLTSIKLWGPVEDAINQGGYRDQIAQALKQNAAADGIPV